MDRRRFLTAAAATSFAGQTLISGDVESAEDATPSAKSGARISNPIALSTYSLWRFRNEAFRDIHRCIDIASEFGFDGG